MWFSYSLGHLRWGLGLPTNPPELNMELSFGRIIQTSAASAQHGAFNHTHLEYGE